MDKPCAENLCSVRRVSSLGAASDDRRITCLNVEDVSVNDITYDRFMSLTCWRELVGV